MGINVSRRQEILCIFKQTLGNSWREIRCRCWVCVIYGSPVWTAPLPLQRRQVPLSPGRGTAAPRAPFAVARVHLRGLNELQGLGNECA